ncbi:hypothetical protein CLV78_10999 [Aliiruegeria haliotis]|uniref:Uncharacterized protein n=1 Tax=Aliiruegeria haliotis TaxID=1280846 RepID=A0A2T0RJX2_9RHOB|nr:hypothetical protein [Aliiruegeria haliotis]PRY21486.1 hypothetical protein CLV78_10999 [Aliiruegeria haliotis]
MKGDANDPKALIREAYRIDGITEAECRSIFMDWALSLPDGVEARDVIPELARRHAEADPDHPMSLVLREGAATARPPARRGGWRGRRGRSGEDGR